MGREPDGENDEVEATVTARSGGKRAEHHVDIGMGHFVSIIQMAPRPAAARVTANCQDRLATRSLMALNRVPLSLLTRGSTYPCVPAAELFEVSRPRRW